VGREPVALRSSSSWRCRQRWPRCATGAVVAQSGGGGAVGGDGGRRRPSHGDLQLYSAGACSPGRSTAGGFSQKKKQATGVLRRGFIWKICSGLSFCDGRPRSFCAFVHALSLCIKYAPQFLSLCYCSSLLAISFVPPLAYRLSVVFSSRSSHSALFFSFIF
jgi:hypothetical protein